MLLSFKELRYIHIYIYISECVNRSRWKFLMKKFTYSNEDVSVKQEQEVKDWKQNCVPGIIPCSNCPHIKTVMSY